MYFAMVYSSIETDIPSLCNLGVNLEAEHAVPDIPVSCARYRIQEFGWSMARRCGCCRTWLQKNLSHATNLSLEALGNTNFTSTSIEFFHISLFLLARHTQTGPAFATGKPEQHVSHYAMLTSVSQARRLGISAGVCPGAEPPAC